MKFNSYSILKTTLIFVIISMVYAQEKTGKPGIFPVLRGPYLGQNPPGDTPELFAPGIVSTCNQHSSAVFTPDGKEVYFSRMFPFPAAIMYMKETDGVWTKPEIAPFSGKYNDLTPFISNDGNRIYFTSNRPVSEGAEPGWPPSDFWVVERRKKGWSEPEYLNIRTPYARQQDGASVSENRTFYFSADYKKNRNSRQKSDIYLSVFENGKYSEPVRLPDAVNSESVDGFPFIAPDESYIIITSFRPRGYGMSDLFIAFRKNDGSWTKPKNMGRKINSSAKEAFPYVTADGKYLFFMSNRVSSLNERKIPDGPGNIYWVNAKIIYELKEVN